MSSKNSTLILLQYLRGVITTSFFFFIIVTSFFLNSCFSKIPEKRHMNYFKWFQQEAFEQCSNYRSYNKDFHKQQTMSMRIIFRSSNFDPGLIFMYYIQSKAVQMLDDKWSYDVRQVQSFISALTLNLFFSFICVLNTYMI